MKEEKELKILRSIARKIVKKTSLKKLSKVRDKKDKIESIKYLIKSSIDMKYYDLCKELKETKDKKKDVFIAATKINLLSSKIKLFNATFEKEDLDKILELFKNIKKELKNA